VKIDPTQRSPLNALMLWLAIGSFIVGAVLRVFAANDDLWFDEVWTLRLLQERVHSFGDVFVNFKHSNNHHLCSLWMWLVGQNASPMVYRLPSLVASIATIVLAGLIGLRQSRLTGSIAVILTAWSYLLIHFGTEARGYSMVVFFALLAWYALQQFEERRSWIWIGVFWSAVVLGFLAHLEFAVCLAGLAFWSLRRLTSNRSKSRQAVFLLFALFTVPVMLLLVFYFVSIRGMEVAGGPTYQLWPLLIKTASYTLGGPASGGVAAIITLLALAASCIAIIHLKHERDDRWIFYSVVLMTPLVLVAITQPEQLYVRYFLISVAMSLLLFSSASAFTSRRGIAELAIGLTLLALYVSGNLANTINLLRFGRGQYLAALLFIETHSRDKKVQISSSSDLRNGTLVNYYKRYLERPDDLQYVDQETLQKDYVHTNGRSLGAEWLILPLHDFTKPRAQVADEHGNGYQLVSIYRYSDLSGSSWLLYHNLNRPWLAPQSPLSQ
jgi:hypothetical protein